MFLLTYNVGFDIYPFQVPKPTTNGEIWVFNRTYTQYIPLSIYELQVNNQDFVHT